MWRVRDWDNLYENSRTRAYERLNWVPMPNKHDGDGYTQLIEHEHGASHYGAWCVLVQVASKCRPRGTLVRDNGQAHDAESLARLTRIGAHIFREAIPRFVEAGWLEVAPDSDLSGDCQQTGLERNGTERNGKEKNIRPAGKADGGPDGILEVREDWESENWRAARRMHVEAANKLWPERNWEANPMKPEDRLLLLKAAYLAVRVLSPDWWHTALEETLKAGPRKPLGLFKTCLRKRPTQQGMDLNELLDRVAVPDGSEERRPAR